MMIMAGSSLCILSINASAVMSFHYFDHEFMLWTIFLAVIGTTIPTALFAAGISKIGAGISSILMTVELPVAILCARVVLGEHISAIQMAGVIIMLSSICAMNYYKNRKSHG
jgi:drug/metabolite transporter (DMT)-like permease